MIYSNASEVWAAIDQAANVDAITDIFKQANLDGVNFSISDVQNFKDLVNNQSVSVDGTKALLLYSGPSDFVEGFTPDPDSTTGPTLEILQIQTNTDPLVFDFGATDFFDLANDVNLGFLENDGTVIVGVFSPEVLESAGLFDTVFGGGASGSFQPGNINIADNSANWSVPIDTVFSNPFMAPSVLNLPPVMAPINIPYTPIDPLVLDLNGDGVQLQGFASTTVYFDIDHDGVVEDTGWVTPEDGILVFDLEPDGIINSSKEFISEYYNGVEGVGGSPGSTPFANSFEALASLDSNNDNVLIIKMRLGVLLMEWVVQYKFGWMQIATV